jgi:hypothetical protein
VGEVSVSLGAEVSPDLAWVVDVLWGDLAGVSVTIEDPPPGVRVVERFIVVPDARRPRLLLPEETHAAWTAARSGNGTRSVRAGAERTVAALAIRGGLGRLVFGDRLTVYASGDAAATLADTLAGILGQPVVLSVNVRPPGPYRKPVLQALAPGGGLLAYAKVAWNELTDANVRAEAAALTAVASTGRLGAPRVIGESSWRGHTVLLTAPLPAGLRRYPSSRGAPDPAITAAVSELFGIEESAYASSSCRIRLHDRLAAVHASGVVPEVAEALGGVIEALEHRGATSFRIGAWHGDWSPWNLGLERDRLWAWDWEFCRRDVPVGLDLLHLRFQVSFIGRRSGLTTAIERARTDAAGDLRALGWGDDALEVIGAIHLAEVALRYAEAEAAGARANPRFLAEAVPLLRADTRRIEAA